MKKIVFVINDLKGNGAERVVITLARAMQKKGHQTHIVCFKETIEYDIGNLPVSIFPIKYWRWIPRSIRGIVISRLLDRRIRQITSGEPDLVLSNLLPCDRIMCRSSLRNVHLVIHCQMSMDSNAESILEKRKIYKCKPIICVSEGVKEDFLNLFPEQSLQTVTVHNPVDIDLINQESHKYSPILDRIPKPYIVHVGKFKTEKRHDLLLKAFALAKTSHHLVLVGQGPLIDASKALARQLNIEHLVHFVGFQKNPFPIIKNASLLVLTSDFEGLGMVLLEAIALGTPVISTDCPSGPNEILEPHQLTPVNDPLALSRLLQSNSFNVYSTSLQSRFNIETAVQKYLELAA